MWKIEAWIEEDAVSEAMEAIIWQNDCRNSRQLTSTAKACPATSDEGY